MISLGISALLIIPGPPLRVKSMGRAALVFQGMFATCKRSGYGVGMSTPPAAPEGYRLVPIEGRQLVRTVAFRVTDEEEALLEELRDTMPSRKMSEAIRWLIASATVRKVITDQIKASRHG